MIVPKEKKEEEGPLESTKIDFISLRDFET